MSVCVCVCLHAAGVYNIYVCILTRDDELTLDYLSEQASAVQILIDNTEVNIDEHYHLSVNAFIIIICL